MPLLEMSSQFLSVKLGRIRVFSNAERAGLKERDFVYSVNGQEVMKGREGGACRAGVRAGPQGGVQPGHQRRQPDGDGGGAVSGH
jgi:hypothetical protein